jgi:phosphoribosylformylglycinamidine synthase
LNHETWLVRNKVLSTLSPFIREDNLWEEYLLNISHWEWKFQINNDKFEEYLKNWQIVMQYQDENWNPTNKYNGSHSWIAAMTSPDWKILVAMPHIERVWLNVGKNVPWEKLLPMFENAYKFYNQIK